VSRPRRFQRTVYIEGCRVLLRWDERGRGRVKVTDPAGDYAKELDVARHVVGVASEHGIQLARPAWLILDHES
jgi:hypothetical protein